MSDKQPRGEILLPERGLRIGHWVIPPKTLQIIKWAIILVMLSWVGWALQNFLSLRGVMSVFASRINLAFIWLLLFGIGFLVTVNCSRKMVWRSVIAIALLVSVLGLDWWAPKPSEVAVSQVRTDDPKSQLRLAINLYSTQLGKALTEEGAADRNATYQALFDHSVVIWGDKMGFFVLFEDGHYEDIPELTLPPNPKARWANEKWRNDTFKPQPPYLAPDGSVAHLWFEQPRYRALMGEEIWWCGISGATYRRFENGMVTGAFRRRGNELWDQSQVYVLFSGKWTTVQSDKPAPPCSTAN